MPTIRLKCVSDNDERFEIRGAVRGRIDAIANLTAAIIEEESLPIEGLPDGPLPTFTATILGLPDPPELVQDAVESDLTAEVKDQDGNLVDIAYDPTRWTWAIVSDEGGGASFGGVDGDDLTASSAPGTLVISATHTETGAVAQATISVVAAIVLTYVLEGLPAEVVETNDYPMTARVLNADGSENEAYNPANWTFSIDSGPGSITGTNSDVLSIPSAVAPATTVVRATHTSTNFDTESVDVIAAAPTFPEVLEPAGMSVLLANEGDTTDFGTGWVPQQSWDDPNKLAVVADASSKYGNALEKRGFIGDSNWLDAYNRRNQGFGSLELYIRYVFRFASNWQRSSSEQVFWYGRFAPGESPSQFRLSILSGGGLGFWNGLTGSDVGDPSKTGTYESATPALSQLALDQYHTVELLHRLNSPGNADGYLRVAVNGTEVTTWNILGGENGVDVRSGVEWVTWDPAEFTGAAAFHRWSSSASKSVNDWVRMSELYISGRNT